MLQGDQLAARFHAIGAFLKQHQALWKPRPFMHAHLGWEEAYPDLGQWLRGRSLAQAEAGLKAPLSLSAPAPYPALAVEAAQLSAIGPLPEHTIPPASERLARDVPGRKWQQIEAFARHLGFQPAPEYWLDWCAGKGHLGRRLVSGTGHHLTSYEYDPALVAEGQAMSDRHGLVAEHHCVDVLCPEVALPAGATPVALHACGDLHVRLLQLAAKAQCQALAIAPCCYNRTAALEYQPLSTQGQAVALSLGLEDLALPASEAVTAGARVIRQRDASMARRLGFDLLQRRLRGVDSYLPTPSVPVSWLAKPFEDYCRHLAGLKGVHVPEAVAWASLEASGWDRLAQVRNLELPRAVFRRPLELWLVLDRALWLVEQGYHVRLGTFCDAALTPRNLLLLAQRK